MGFVKFHSSYEKVDGVGEVEIKAENTNTNDAMYQLQLLFATLEKGIQKYFKPLELANTLGLNLTYQQDAEEYFLSFIFRL